MFVVSLIIGAQKKVIFAILTLRNTRLVKMGATCDICYKTYSLPRKLCRHKQEVHEVLPQTKPFSCSECDYEKTSLVFMQKHFLQKHGHILVNHCCSFNFIYGDGAKNLNHAECVHTLSTKFTQRENSDIERNTGYKQTEKSFTGSLQAYELKRKITSNILLELSWSMSQHNSCRRKEHSRTLKGIDEL